MTVENDSYLEIAERVLARYRTPMSTQQIMRQAFLNDLVPPHLHGGTQHKTLGARLSEDILRYRQRSRFFRTRPGRFFIRSLMKDRSLPVEYRTPIVAKRRRRELKTRHLAFLKALPQSEPDLFHRYPVLTAEGFEDEVRRGNIGYADQVEVHDRSLCGIYAYVIVSRGEEVLVHRRGNYREGRRSFVQKLSLGFSCPISHDDMTLFDFDDHGLVSAGITALAIDLDVEFSSELPKFEEAAHLQLCPIVPGPGQATNLIGIVRVEAPTTFEPTRKRLAINDLGWMYMGDRRARVREFDPWSRYLIRELRLGQSNAT